MFRELVVIQSTVIVFLSIHLLIRKGSPLISQQSLKTLLVYNGMTGSQAGPGGCRNNRKQLMCWGKQRRGMSCLERAASKGCTVTTRLHWWDSPGTAPMACTSRAAAGTSLNTHGVCEHHHPCCSSNATPGWPKDTPPSVPA